MLDQSRPVVRIVFDGLLGHYDEIDRLVLRWARSRTALGALVTSSRRGTTGVFSFVPLNNRAYSSGWQQYFAEYCCITEIETKFVRPQCSERDLNRRINVP